MRQNFGVFYRNKFVFDKKNRFKKSYDLPLDLLQYRRENSAEILLLIFFFSCWSLLVDISLEEFFKKTFLVLSQPSR